MARLLSQPMIRASQTLILCPSSRLVSSRFRSHKPAGKLVEIDIESEASSGGGGGGGDVEVLSMRRLEDAIHGIMARRAAPDWLPFIPGSSYWVPPPKRNGFSVIELIGEGVRPLTVEESMSLTTPRGWPSLAYFVEGKLPRPENASSENTLATSDDEE